MVENLDLSDIDRAVREIQKFPRFESAEDLRVADMPPRTWFVDGFLTPGNCLLSAKKGIGKTFLAMQMASAIAAGRPFLGRKTVRSPVAYFFGELDRTAIHERLAKLGPQDPNFKICTSWPRGSDAIETAENAFKTGIKVLIIDMISSIMPLEQDYSGYGVSNFLLDLRRVSHKYGACTLLIHHATKAARDDWMDAALGSTGFQGQCDCAIHLERKRGVKNAKLFAGGNHGRELSVSVRFEDCLWSLADDNESDEPEVKAQPSDYKYYKLLEETPAGMTAPQMAALTGKKENTVRSAMSRLLYLDMVEKYFHVWRIKRTKAHQSALPLEQCAPSSA